MKTQTKAKILTGVMGVTTLLPLPLSLVGCDNGTQTKPEVKPEPEQPKDQTATIDNLFDTMGSAKIEGNLTDTEWTGVANKIKGALEAMFAAADGNFMIQTAYRTVFGREDVTIIIEKNPTEYPNWKTTGDGRTLYIKPCRSEWHSPAIKS